MAGEPLPLELRFSLRPGSVFYSQLRELHSAEPHFFIVANRDPLGTNLLLITIVTSQIDKVRIRNRERPDTVVEITPAEYAEFTKHSAIDCNVIFEKPVSDLAEMVRQKHVRYHIDLPAPLLEKIRAAIKASPVVEDELKALL